MHIDQFQMSTSPGRNAEQVSDSIYYEKILEKNEDDFEMVDPREEFTDKIKELVRDQEKQVESQLDEFGEPFTSLVVDVVFPKDDMHFGWAGPNRDRTATAKYTGDLTEEPVLCLEINFTNRRRLDRIMHDSSDMFKIVVVSTSESDRNSFYEFVNDEVEEIDKYIGDFAELKEFNSGPHIVDGYFSSKVNDSDNLTDWSQDEEANPFEQEVYQKVSEITSITRPNMRIQTDVGDNPDFDVVALPIGELGSKFAIEVKDYLQEENDEVDEKPANNKESGELRSELIRKPKEYSEQADLELITVVKGLSEEQFQDLKRLAESSGISLLDGDSYKEDLDEIILNDCLRKLSEVRA